MRFRNIERGVSKIKGRKVGIHETAKLFSFSRHFLSIFVSEENCTLIWSLVTCDKNFLETTQTT